jgi:DNA-directed RNA polymerase specialized sigma24 family protein
MNRQRSALSGDGLSALLRFLNEDADRGAAEYERIRQRLIKLFRWRGCRAAEEYADVTVDRVGRLLADGRVTTTTTPYALFHGVALNLLREHWRRVERERQALASVAHDTRPAASADELLTHSEAERADEERRRCLRRCLMRLAPHSRRLITRYYAGGSVLDKNHRKAAAAELQITVNALRVRAHRVRSEVGECIERCLDRARS